MHHIHHTKAIVLSTEQKRESDLSVVLYTENFGMIRATARGARNLRSKLRFALQPYTIAQIDLIEIKNGFRIGSAIPLSVPSGLTLYQYSTLYKFSKLIVRLCAGEERHPELFSTLLETYSALLSPDFKETQIAGVEMVGVLRTLFHLGYITGDIPSDFVRSPIDLPLLEEAETLRSKLVKKINESLKETML